MWNLLNPTKGTGWDEFTFNSNLVAGEGLSFQYLGNLRFQVQKYA